MPSETHPTQLPVGALPLPDGTILFRVWAPRARELEVELLDTRPNGLPLEKLRFTDRVSMSPIGHGLFEARVAASPGSDYAFRLDRQRRRADPASRWQPFGVHGPSRVFDASALCWTDQHWMPPTRDTLVMSQLHVGTYAPSADFAGIMTDLPRLASLGINALQLMPVAQFPGTRNWGYDGVFPYAVQASYGGPLGLAALVDACHGHGIAVYLDLVFNHLGPEGNYTEDFGPYSNSRFHTPWGNALNYDEVGSACVRRFFIDHALYFSRELHVDGFRFDAIAQVFDSSPRHILRETIEALPVAPRHLNIAESELNANRVLTRDTGGLGFDAQWNDDFHHALMTRLTGNHSAFLADFKDAETLPRVLREGWSLAGGWSEFRERFHGEPCAARPEQLVVFSQDHDQIAGVGGGRRLGSAEGPETQELLLVLTLLSGFVPMLFAGQDFGATTDFHYFVDHADPGLVRRVVAGRRHEQRQVAPSARYLSPATPRAWASSRLDWAEATSAAGRKMQGKLRSLTELRRRYACFQARSDRRHRARWESDFLVHSASCAGSRGVLVAHLPEPGRGPARKRGVLISTLERWFASEMLEAKPAATSEFSIAYRTERALESERKVVFDGPSAIVLIAT